MRRLTSAFLSPSPNAFPRSALPAALCLLGPAAFAQPTAAPAAQPQEPLVVTATPWPRTADLQSSPATVLRRADLERMIEPNLGDTLSGLPGVSSSSFAPGAGRPILRGQDGPRVQILENGLGVNDVSRLSPDHRVASNADSASQIEILRGPATLLYGSGAIGGLVNVVNERIPERLLKESRGLVSARAANAASQAGLNGRLQASAGNVAWQIDGSHSRGNDYRFRGEAIEGDPSSATGRMPNSAWRSQEMGAGFNTFFDRGSAGGSVSTQHARYGVPGGDAYLTMRQARTELAGTLKFDSIVDRLKLKLASSSYGHDEVEAASNEVAVSFKNKATELRGELTLGTAKIAGADWSQSAVLQTSTRNFSARSPSGDFEIVEPNTTRATALAWVHELSFANGAFALDAGLRSERESVRPAVQAARHFSLNSASLGAVWRFAPGYALALTASRSERAPQAEELFTRGPHEATQTFEVGDPRLKTERAHALDLSVRKISGALQGSVSVFSQRFANYIFAQATDIGGTAARVDDEGVFDPAGELLFLEYKQGAARLSGFEFELKAQLGADFSVRTFGDRVRASLSDGSALPRITPARIGLGASYTRGAWSVGADVLRVSAAKRLALVETATRGYTKVDLSASYKLHDKFMAYALLRNAGDAIIRIHSSALKDSVPQPGRSFVLGLQTRF